MSKEAWLNMAKIVNQIRDMYQDLPASKKRVASYFLNNYSTLYLDTVLELAEKIGVSDTTIINFCSDLGFYGFSGFKKAIREELRSESDSIHDVADNNPSEIAERLLKLQAGNSASIELTFSDKDNLNAMEQAVELLSQANKVYCIGFYRSACVAKMAALTFSRYNYRSEAIYPDLGDYIDHLLWADEGDVAIVYDLSLYSTGITEICTILKEKNVPIILITDMGPCPRISMSDVVIHCIVDDEANMGPSGTEAIELTVTSAILGTLRTFFPHEDKEYNKKMREGVFTRFNPYGVYEPSGKNIEII